MLFIGWEMKYNENSHSCGQLVIGSFIITCTHSYIMSHAEFFGKTSNHPNDSAPYDPDLAPWYFWLFPKLKSPLKGKKFQTIDEIQENMMRQLMATGRTVWGPKVPTVKGTEASLSYVQCFLYLVSSLINSLFFIFHGWIPPGQTIYIIYNI